MSAPNTIRIVGPAHRMTAPACEAGASLAWAETPGYSPGSGRSVAVVRASLALGEDQPAARDDDPLAVLPPDFFDKTDTRKPGAGRDAEYVTAAAHIDKAAARADNRPSLHDRRLVAGGDLGCRTRLRQGRGRSNRRGLRGGYRLRLGFGGGGLRGEDRAGHRGALARELVGQRLVELGELRRLRARRLAGAGELAFQRADLARETRDRNLHGVPFRDRGSVDARGGKICGHGATEHGGDDRRGGKAGRSEEPPDQRIEWLGRRSNRRSRLNDRLLIQLGRRYRGRFNGRQIACRS